MNKAAAAIVLAATGSVASAQFVSDVIYTLTAENANGTDTRTIRMTSPGVQTVDGGFTWTIGDNPALQNGMSFSNGAVLDASSQFGISVGATDGSPFGSGNASAGSAPASLVTSVFTNFSGTAGASDTVFTISTAVVGVGTINNMFSGSGGFALTDTTPAGGSATVSAGDPAFGADFIGYFFGGSLAGTLLTGPASTATSISGSDFVNGSEAGLISTLSLTYSVTVTADDQFGGNAFFAVTGVIPSPGVLGLAGLSGLVAARRRR